MNTRIAFSNPKVVFLAALATVLLTGVGTAEAQDRADRWELGLAVIYQLGTDLDFDRGSMVSTSDDFGFVIDGGYNFTDNLAVNFGFEWAGVGYNAEVIDDQGDTIGIRGSYDAFSLFSNLVYYIGDGALAPYVGAGIGWTWIDTNVPNGPPVTGCWWDPWWGWVCYTTYPTETTSAFSYQAIIGVRYEFNYSSYLRFAYTSQWINLDNADGTPRFDVISAEFGWMF